MGTEYKPTVEAFFIPGGKENIFATLFKPDNSNGGAVIYIPPFAEEANRCRAIAAQQARVFAQQGYACLLIDPYGTGDSAGELEDASWDIWKDDINAANDWLAQRYQGEIILWGVRLGALLACNLLNDYSERYKKAIVWQPVLNGKTYLTQVLRQRVVSLTERNEPAETTAQMMQQLSEGQQVEVAGYVLSEQLTTAIKNTSLTKLKNFSGSHLIWLEIIATEEESLTIASQRALEHLSSTGATVSSSPVISPPIWILQKRTEAPALIESTMNFL